MFEIVLYEPEIAPNTGNIIRLCANNGCRLHLIEPLGFDFSEKNLKRASLDYQDLTHITIYSSFNDFRVQYPEKKIYALTTHGKLAHTQPHYEKGDILLFGPETRGLPSYIKYMLPQEQLIRIPMLSTARSLNLSNSVAITSYEAWRQHHFQ